MGYILPLHYSAYHHIRLTKNSQAELPFRFTNVPKIRFKKSDNDWDCKSVATTYQANKQFKPMDEDLPTQILLSKLTGIGSVVNVLV